MEVTEPLTALHLLCTLPSCREKLMMTTGKQIFFFFLVFIRGKKDYEHVKLVNDTGEVQKIVETRNTLY